jgi:uncharacterized protein (TIGR03382 family)
MRTRSVAAVGLGLALSLSACSGDPPRGATQQDVIGGTVTPEGMFPGIGALYSSTFGAATCTGTLIAPDVVLTAAHCIDPAVTGSAEVPGFTLVHDTITSQPAFTVGERMVKHPSFDINSLPPSGLGDVFDIGLVFLTQPITAVAPVRMPSTEEVAGLTPGTMLDLVGYGVTEVDGFETGVMFNGRAPLISLGTSEIQISNPGDIQNCYGDSGGPALVDLGGGVRVVGVVSRSYNGNICNQGGVDTRVDSYRDWIYQESGVCAVGDARCTPDASLATEVDADDGGGDDDGGDDDGGGGGGGCSTSGAGGSGALVLALAVLLGARRRRS